MKDVMLTPVTHNTPIQMQEGDKVYYVYHPFAKPEKVTILKKFCITDSNNYFVRFTYKDGRTGTAHCTAFTRRPSRATWTD